MYVHGNVPKPDLTGVRGYIRVQPITLCGEGTSTEYAQSNAFLGVTGPNNHWAQVGFLKKRTTAGGTVFKNYVEICGGNLSQRLERFFEDRPPQSGVRTHYVLFLELPANGHWQAEVNDSQYTANLGPAVQGWANLRGSRADFTAEKFNIEDKFPGTPNAKCNFTDLETQQFSGEWAVVTLPANIYNTDPSKYGSARVSNDSFDVWDKR